jgi:FecR protein
MFKNKYLAYILLMAAMGVAISARVAEAAQVGSVIFAAGEAQILGVDGKARAAAKGEAVNQGDTLVTGKAGAMQVRMADDGFIALRPDTRMTVQDFNWNGKEDGAERSVMSLVRGGFRTITGVIGRRNKDNYQVRTPTATIGIRGTDHEPHYIASPAPGETPLGEPGAYNKVNVGATYISNALGTVELGPNEVGFAPVAPGQPPVRLKILPGFMRNAPVPFGAPDFRELREERREARREMIRERLLALADGDEQRARLLFLLLRYGVIAAGSTFDLNNPASSLTPAPVGYAAVGGLYAGGVANSGGMAIGPNSQNLVLLGPQNNPLFIADAGGFRYARGVSPLIESGSTFIGATPVQWGIYAGGTGFTPAAGAFPVQAFHFMNTPNVTSFAQLQVPGTASFSTTAGFTTPMNNLGVIGGTASLSVTVVFGAIPTITGYSLSVVDGSARTWNMSLPSAQTLVNFATAPALPNLTGTCTPCGVAVGTASGFVIGGAARNGFISSYDLKAVGGNSVTGSIAVQ